MQVKQVDECMYRIELDAHEEVLITCWAQMSHVDNEEIIDEWLTVQIEKHKLMETNPKKE